MMIKHRIKERYLFKSSFQINKQIQNGHQNRQNYIKMATKEILIRRNPKESHDLLHDDTK